MNILHNLQEELFPSLITKVATLYANFRIRPTRDEIRSYNKTNKILLTFDDFADKARVTALLSILKQYNIRAAFFLIGDSAKEHPEIVEEIRSAGHWIGNHTKTHANLLKLTDNQIREEILGGPASSLLRPPYGKYDTRIREIAKDMGYKICYWDVDSHDWRDIGKEEIALRVIPSIGPGSCVLLHMNGASTLDALPFLIEEIKQKGFLLCSTGEEIMYD